MKSNMKFFNNDEGVSPIIATLVLIVVAIIGAAAVGLIMGSFSNNVGKQAAGDGGASQATAVLNIAGSSTVKPLTDALIPGFLTSHPGLKVNNAAGGSGVGVASAANNLVDLGAVSEPLTSNQKTTYPTLQEHVVGKGAVVIIGNGVTGPVTKADLKAVYDADATTSAVAADIPAGTTIFCRSGVSGTQQTLSNYLFGNPTYIDTNPTVVNTGVATLIGTPASSNSDMVTKVSSTAGSIGFADFEFASNWAVDGKAVVNIIGVTDGTTTTPAVASGAASKPLRDAILKTLTTPSATGAGCYIPGLCRPLEYLTNGVPSAMEQSWLDYVSSPSTQPTFDNLGLFHPLDYTVVP